MDPKHTFRFFSVIQLERGTDLKSITSEVFYQWFAWGKQENCKGLDPKLVVICGLQSPEGASPQFSACAFFYSTQMAHIEPAQALSAICADLKWTSCVGSVG